MMKTIALIPAAGVGSRFGASCPKQYIKIHQKTVLEHSVDIFLRRPEVDLVVVIVSEDDGFIDSLTFSERVLVIKEGGESRAKSVKQGLDYLLKQRVCTEDDWILVHDAARCGLPSDALLRLLQLRDEKDVCGGLLALPVADTLKRQDAQLHVDATVDRSGLWQAQTPQMFTAKVLNQALNSGSLDQITDEASAVEALGFKPKLVLGDGRNIKLTLPQDEVLMSLILN